MQTQKERETEAETQRDRDRGRHRETETELDRKRQKETEKLISVCPSLTLFPSTFEMRCILESGSIARPMEE